MPARGPRRWIDLKPEFSAVAVDFKERRATRRCTPGGASPLRRSASAFNLTALNFPMSLPFGIGVPDDEQAALLAWDRQRKGRAMTIRYPDEFDLDVRLTSFTDGGQQVPVVVRDDTEVTCFSTCSGPECQTSDTCSSTCSPCETVDASTYVGDCTNDCHGPAETAFCDTHPGDCTPTNATCGGRECSTNWQTCQGATCEETGGCSTCAQTCVGDTCPGSTCAGSTCDC